MRFSNRKGFRCGSAGKESACNAVFDPWIGKIPSRMKGYLLQYSDLENSMDYTVHGVSKSQTQLSNFHFSLQIGKLSNNAIENIVMIEELSVLEE